MKKITILLLVLTLLLGSVSFPTYGSDNIYKEFFVDGINGKDTNSGSKNAPFKTIQKAQTAVREAAPNMTGDIIVNISSGRYELSDSIEFEKADSGLNGHRVIYRGDKDNKPVLSGGIEISGFTEGDNGIWQAEVDLRFIRDLSVNGVMADMAKSENKIFGVGHYNPTYNSSGAVSKAEGIYVNKADLGLYKNPSDIEFKWEFAHADALVHVEDLRQDPNNANQVIVEFQNPFWNSVFNKNTAYYSQPGNPGWEIGFSVRNAFELLDEPGEFYYDKVEKILYYMPREGEDMTCAEVICPVIDKVMGVRGRGPLNKITNLSFENLVFAHTTWSDLDENSVYYNQAEAPMVNFAPGGMTPGAVEVSWIDGLSVTGCDFYGLSTIGLKLYEGVTNSTIEGNTFADIGSGAITVGFTYHTKYDEPTAQSGAANVFFRKGWTTGHQTHITTNRPFYINSSTSDQEYYSSYTWTNANELAENPEALSYIKADLGKPYDISSIMLDFNNVTTTVSGVSYAHTYTSEEMSNFDVRVSNDRYFNTYESIRNVGTNRTRRLTIQENLSQKYRYVMIIKTKPEPFAMTFMRVYSYDEDKVGQKESGLCKNIMIRNNYVTRAAQLHTGAPAITAYYTENVTIDHNVITQVPYSGINVGWGWDAVHSTPKNNTVSNNYISDYMLQCVDGGAIYVLGTNQNSRIFGNYIKDGHNGYGAIYTDSGSVGFDISNNVVDNGHATVFIAGGSIKNITGSNNYGATVDAEPFRGTVTEGQDGYALYKIIENKGTNCTIDEGISMLPNNYLKGAAEIAFNAGLTDEYKHILENVPEKNDTYYDGVYSNYSMGRKSEVAYSNYTNTYKRIHYYDGYLDNVSKNGFFGNEPWQYTPSLKYQISELHERTRQMYNKKAQPTTSVTGWFRGAHVDELYMAKYLVDNVVRAVKHLSYDEMVDIVNERLEDAVEGYSFGKYKSGAKAELHAALNYANSMPSATEADKYMRVTYLENAVNTFDSKKISDEIIYAYLSYGKTKIDKEEKTVTITMPKGVSFANSKVEFMAVGDTTVSYSGTLQNNVPKTLNIQNYDVYGINTEWKLIVKNEEFLDATDGISALSDDWYNSNDNADFKERRGSLAFQPWVYPYMYKTPVKGEIKFSLKADRADNQDGINFIFSSASGADLEYDGKGYAKNTYYKMTITGSTVTVYQVKSGTPTAVASNDFFFNYGEYNDITLLSETISGKDYLTLMLGNSIIFDRTEIGTIGTDGYFGILTKSVKAEIMVEDDKPWNIAVSKDLKTVDVYANISDKDLNTLLFTAFYDANDRLIGIYKEDILESGYTYDIPEGTKRIAAFQIEGMDKLNPLRFKGEYIIN